MIDADLMQAVRAAMAVSDDLRYKKWRGRPNPETGLCYVASEAIYYMGGKDDGWKPCNLKWESTSHWFLVRGDEICDPTVSQFVCVPAHAKGTCRGFLTKAPSWRADQLMGRAAPLLQRRLTTTDV